MILNELTVDGIVEFNSNVNVKSNLLIENELEVKSNVCFSNDLFVKGIVEINSNIEIQGISTLSNNVLIKGELIIDNNVEINSNLIIENNLSVKKSLRIESNLIVDEETTLKKIVTIESNLVCENDLIIENNLSVKENLYLNSNLEIIRGNVVIGNMVDTDIKINAHGSIKAKEFLLDSDKRIKTNIEDLNSDIARKILNKLDIKLFNKITNINSNKKSVGIIAQELEDILIENNLENTNIINKNKAFVPDLMIKMTANSKNSLYSLINNTDNIKKFENIQIINQNTLESKIVKVIDIYYDKLFCIKINKLELNVLDEYLLYGHQVDDYCSIDYSQLFCILLKAIKDKLN